MVNWFNRSLKIPKVKTSVHDLSNDYKSSINFGGLYPTYLEDCVPKTKFLGLSSEIFLRFAPMKFPIMHRCKVRQNTFGVPYRLILGDENYTRWTNNEVDLPYLTLDVNGISEGFSFKNTILDYLGRDVQALDKQLESTPDELYLGNCMDIFSYLLIWRTWYADEVLDAERINSIDMWISSLQSVVSNATISRQPELIIPWDTFADFLGGDGVLPVSYTKDYFTAAQTEPQRGGDVYLMNPLSLVPNITSFAPTLGTASFSVAGPSNPSFSEGSVFVNGGNVASGQAEVVRTTDTIRDLWQKEQLQRYRDISALFGTRTNEYLAGHFGVVSSDARLQMPQFIGGGEQIVQISEVVQTSSDTETSPLGAMAGKGTSFGHTKSMKYFCEEHMFIVSLLCVVPDNGYMTGNPRYVYKQNIFDYASPEFNNIGYQPVYNGEIFATDLGTDKQEFGYQPRYSEYRQHRSIATGDFRDSTLMAWHLNRNFSALPPLNENFIHVNQSDSARIFNDTDADNQHIYIDVFNKVTVSSVVSYMPSSLHL